LSLDDVSSEYFSGDFDCVAFVSSIRTMDAADGVVTSSRVANAASSFDITRT